MENREDVVMLASSLSVGKPGHRGCVSPYSRDTSEERIGSVAAPSANAERQPGGEQTHKDGSSSDPESDFYEEIDVSCTPESMDYPTAKGRTLMEIDFRSQVNTVPFTVMLFCERFRDPTWCHTVIN